MQTHNWIQAFCLLCVLLHSERVCYPGVPEIFGQPMFAPATEKAFHKEILLVL